MAYIKFGNQLLNTDFVYYVDTNPGTLITINSKKGIQQISADEWDDIKGDLIACSNFKEITNYGYVNLDLVVDVWKTDDNYYTIKFGDITKNLSLTPENTEGIDETVFNEIKAYVKATGGGGGGGTTNYDALSSKPKINGKVLTGDKTAAELGLAGKADLDAKADNTDLNKLEQKDTELEGKITTNTQAIATEKTDRETKDVELGNKITAIETAYKQADTELGNKIGNINDLETAEKDLVKAINEIKNAQTQGGYVLPAATDAKLGGVKVKGTEGIKVTTDGVISVDKASIQLDKVDNTADADKEISTKAQAALDLKLDKSAIEQTITEATDKVPSSKAVKDALTNAGKIAGATLDGQDVTIGNDQKLEIVLPKGNTTTAGIVKASTGLKSVTDGEIEIDDTVVATKEKLDEEVTNRTNADTKLNNEKLDKIIPILTDGESYKANQIVFKDKKLVRVIKDITNYEPTTNAADLSVFIDDVNATDYSFIHHYALNSSVKANEYIFKDGVFYKAVVDIASIQEADLIDTGKFTEVYSPAAFALPKAEANVLGGVQIGDGISVDRQTGKISIDKTKLPVIVYQENNQHIPANTLVIHADDLYICTTEVATTAGWNTDSVNMEPVDTNTSEVDVIDYDTIQNGETIKKGKIVVYNNKIYLAKAEITKAGWDTDLTDLIETALQIDLAQYYKKTEINDLLKNKASISIPTVAEQTEYKQNQLVLKADGYIYKVSQDIQSYEEANDGDKLEAIADLSDYYKKAEVDSKVDNKANLVLPTIDAGSNYKANQLAIYKDLLVKVKEDITGFSEQTDATKLDNIGYLPTASATVLGGIKLGNGLEDKANDGVVSVKVKTDGYLKVEADGVDIDDTNIEKTTLTDSETNIPSSKLVKGGLDKKLDAAIPTLTDTQNYTVGSLVAKATGEVYKVSQEITSYDENNDSDKLTEIASLKNSKTLSDAIVNLATAFEDFKKNFAVNTADNTLFFTEDQYNTTGKEEGKLYIIKQ